MLYNITIERTVTRMKKAVKLLGIATAGVVAGAAISFVKDYHTMKKMQEKLDKMPVNMMKKKMAKIKRKEDHMTIEVPYHMMLADKLRVCARILKN